jgi:hypothetical protein
MNKQSVWRRARISTSLQLAAWLAATGAYQGEALAQGRNDTVVLSGQSAPGAGAGTFSTFQSPVLNDAGQIAFRATITGGTSTVGVYRKSVGATLAAIALQGQSAPGAGAGTFSGFSSPALNDAGQTAFEVGITGGTSAGGIYRSSSGTALTAIALQGQSAPGIGVGTFSGFDNPVLNDSGQTAFDVAFTGSTSTAGIIRSTSGSGLTAVALQGQSAPGAGAGTFSDHSRVVLNDIGQTAFLGTITGGTSTSGIYRSSSGSALTAIALQGQSAPGAGAGTFSIFGSSHVLNNAGQTAFTANITGGTSTRGLYRSSSGSTLTTIALQGQSAPGAGAGTFVDIFDPVSLNDAGQTAFLGSITGGSSTQGIYRSSSGSTLTAIALQGQSAPGAGAGTFSDFSTTALNDTGQMAFRGGITGGSSTSGLYLGDGRDTVAALLLGSPLAGRTVSSTFFASGGFNRHGQLAYVANFTDGSSGSFLFTPALRWRESFGSNWDTADRWTLGIAPAAVHDVNIDPSATLTVTGPAGNAHVRSLTVGGGIGFATLALNGGTLVVTDIVQIASRGILTGSGSIPTLVVNAGEVRADNLMLGGLVNNGTVSGMASGNQRIDTVLTNNTGGVVRVDGGETLKLVGTLHSNSGSFEIRGGEMQMSGFTTNNSGGRILFNASGGIARFYGGLINNGQVQVSFGSAELFGSIVTNSGGKLILSGNSNTTFYDLVDVKSGGELRVSTGSNAVFFGQVLQRTGSLFTGTGTKFYEGGLAIGGSPGLAMDTGDVNLGAGNVFTVDIGGITACTAACDGDEVLRNRSFDKYIVAGHLALGGTLQLASWNGFVLEAGQSFDLLDWGSVSGSFDHIDASGLMLADGVRLDTSRLGLDGSIAITAVPEPQTWALLLTGLALAGLRRRCGYTTTLALRLQRRSELL